MLTRNQLNNLYYFIGIFAIFSLIISITLLQLRIYSNSFLYFIFYILLIFPAIVAGIELNLLLEKTILFFKKPIFLIILLLGTPLYFYFLDLCADNYIYTYIGKDVLDFPTSPKKIIISIFVTMIFTSLTCMFLFYKVLFHFLERIILDFYFPPQKKHTTQTKKKSFKLRLKHWYIETEILIYSTLYPKKYKERAISPKSDIYLIGKFLSQFMLMSMLALLTLAQFKLLELKTSKALFIEFTFTKNNSCNNKDSFKSLPYSGYVLEYDYSNSTISKIPCLNYKVSERNIYSFNTLIVKIFHFLPFGSELKPILFNK